MFIFNIHNLSGQLVPVLCHPQSNEFYSHNHMEFPTFQFVPIGPCSVGDHDQKEPVPMYLSSII